MYTSAGAQRSEVSDPLKLYSSLLPKKKEKDLCVCICRINVGCLERPEMVVDALQLVLEVVVRQQT